MVQAVAVLQSSESATKPRSCQGSGVYFIYFAASRENSVVTSSS